MAFTPLCSMRGSARVNTGRCFVIFFSRFFARAEENCAWHPSYVREGDHHPSRTRCQKGEREA